MKNNHNLEDLLNKYKTGTCSDEERAIVESWHIQAVDEATFMPDEEELNRAKTRIWNALPIHDHPKAQNIRSLWPKYAAVASLFVVISIGLYLFLPWGDKPVVQQTQVERFKNDVNPGGNKAILVLSDGKEVNLDEAQAGTLILQGDARINKTNDGQLVYNKNKQDQGSPLTNKLITPKGGQYRITLPDGTKVWLNSYSTLIYPTSFDGNIREVELIGEAYFNVVKNDEVPFKVHTRNQVVEVLGTHFNINGYTSESTIKTTLLEGSVSVNFNSHAYLLMPGQQADVGNNVLIRNADTDQAVAWMKGDFYFKDENINSIMRKLERWYDIEVVYEGKVSDVNYGAEISRNKSLTQVLAILENTGNVRFKIEGRRVTVME